ncbi:MAG: hypothetical protein JW915_06035 [Chitinispirillaceae bacterium]|nr:hypothetical protein [Chitinispirillaceae bacterium]
MEHIFKKIAVFCGSSSGINPVFYEQATQLGLTLARNNIELVSNKCFCRR